jgi:hypothetical protein
MKPHKQFYSAVKLSVNQKKRICYFQNLVFSKYLEQSCFVQEVQRVYKVRRRKLATWNECVV